MNKHERDHDLQEQQPQPRKAKAHKGLKIAGGISAGLLAVFVGIGIASGSNDNPPAPAPASNSQPAAAGSTAFTAVMDSYGLDGTALVPVGQGICADLSAGSTITLTALAEVDAGFNPTQAGEIVGGSVAAFCPQFTTAVDSFVAAHPS